MLKKGKNELTPKEQKTTVAFKLLSTRVKILERSLKNTQDELEGYREKYHEADKKHAVECNKNKTILLHEVLKFVASSVPVAIGVNYLTNQKYVEGTLVIIGGIILYIVIIFSEKFIKK